MTAAAAVALLPRCRHLGTTATRGTTCAHVIEFGPPPTTADDSTTVHRQTSGRRCWTQCHPRYALAVRCQQPSAMRSARCQPQGQVVTPTATLASIDTGHAATTADEAVVVQALRAAHTLGGPTAATLDAASALLRERAVIRGEAAAFSAQARLSARVLTGVPLVFAAWSALSSRTFRTAIVSPLGIASAVAGGACNLLGWWWMRRIVAKAVT